MLYLSDKQYDVSVWHRIFIYKDMEAMLRVFCFSDEHLTVCFAFE